MALMILSTALACRATEWDEFAARDASFSIRTPGPLEVSIDTIDTPFGVVRSVRHLHADDERSFGVSYADYPEALLRQSTAAELLDDARERTITSLDAKLLGEETIELGRFAGRSLRLEAAGGAITVQSRLYMVRSRLYHVVAVTRRDEAASPDVRRFLDSFQLLRR
jgi:hypothetical protein